MYRLHDYVDRSGVIWYLGSVKDGLVEDEDGHPMQFDFLGYYSDGLIPVQIGDKFVAIDKNGKTLFDMREKSGLKISSCANYYRCGRLAVMEAGRWGFIDTEGNRAIPCIYNEVLSPSFIDGYAVVRTVQLTGSEGFVVIDTEGKEVSPVIIDFLRVTAFNGKYLAVEQSKNKFAILDIKGNLVLNVPGKIGDITEIGENTIVCEMAHEHLGVASMPDKYSVMDFEGKILFNPEPNRYIKMVDENKFLSVWCGGVTTIGRNGEPIEGSQWRDRESKSAFMYFPKIGVIAGDYDSPESVLSLRACTERLVRQVFNMEDCGLYSVDGKPKTELQFRTVGFGSLFGNSDDPVPSLGWFKPEIR